MSDSFNTSILIFGASGDLTARKLMPALFHLCQQKYVSADVPIVGIARKEKTDEQFRAEVLESLRSRIPNDRFDEARWLQFSKQLFYRQLDISNPSEYVALKESVEAIENELRGNSEATAAGTPLAEEQPRHRVVYLATTPSLFAAAVEGLHEAGMIPDRASASNLRVVVEKPFGHDLISAQELTEQLARRLRENQIYRIDHYLGKETVQNILLFRFGNAIFEPLLNRNHVDHIQITVAESQGMEGSRGGYYDTSGALRDVLQNHVLQLLCLIAMDPPSLFQAREIRDEKMKVLQALRPGASGSVGNWAIRGQYTAGLVNRLPALAYREEERVQPNSNTETYVAMRVAIDNWRWAGVPFFLRTGKRLPKQVSEIAIQFKKPPLNLFTTVECEGDLCDLVDTRPNQLILRIQPQEAISLRFSTKRPGMQYQVQPVSMDFEYEDHFQAHLPEAYERLLLDVIRGDSTLFTRSDELEAAWKFVTPVLDAWRNSSASPDLYPAGTWGPSAADRLMAECRAAWRSPR
ncbi:MAG: glucose-6-phosphate dehydrogenase [Planctomyces sp.]|nr:glucose-6-phosphate dehydrogenase [Planctomyces sp.]